MFNAYLGRKKRNRHIKGVTSIDELRKVANDIGFTYFLDYDAQAETKRREFISALRYFNINPNGKAVLDVGPGTADSLDQAKIMGAVETCFIEHEPMFFKFASLKGHSGFTNNYYNYPYFPAQYKNRFDLIYTKGSIECTWVDNQTNRMSITGIKSALRGFNFNNWVSGLKNMLKPGGEIILMPAMGRQTTKIIDPDYDLDTYHWCPDIAAYRDSYFTKTLTGHGFTTSDNVPGFTQKQSFPLAFHYKMPS
jgi:hypothetical protein